MASVYPGGLDNFATNKTNSTTTPNDHPGHHNDLADAVNKIEGELGVDPAGASATVGDRLDALGEWTTWTPTLGNIAVGTGGDAGTVARFCRVGGLVVATLTIRLGSSGGSVSGTPTATLPLTAQALPLNTTRMGNGIAVLGDSGVQVYQGVFNITGTNQVSVLYSAVSAATIVNGAISATTPFTWGAADFITGLFTYETTA